MKSCFPSISREQLLCLAADILTPAQWSLIDQIYTDTYGEIRIQAQASDPMYADRGTIEGGVLSPQLLKLFLSVLLKVLERVGFSNKVNFETMEVGPGQVVIADDVLGFLWSPDDVRVFLAICEWWTNQNRAEFSTDKSNIVIVNREEGVDYGKFYLYGKELKCVTISEHLGVPVTEGPPEIPILERREANTRKAMNTGISHYNPKGFVNLALQVELWRTTYRAVLLYSQECATYTASQMTRVENFQTKALKGIFKVSRRAKTVLVRLLCGLPAVKTELWRARLGAMNNILLGQTMTKDYVLFMLYSEVKKSWSYKTVEWVQKKLEDRGETINVYDFLTMGRESFKTGAKAILYGEDHKQLIKEVEVSRVHKVPMAPFGSPNPLILTDFSDTSKRYARAFVAVFTGDYYRNFNKPCFLCMRPGMTEQEEKKIIDNTEHILTRSCKVQGAPGVQHTAAKITLLMRQYFPDHVMATELVSDEYRARWLLNPTCETLMADRLLPEDLQRTNLDNTIREHFYRLLVGRYDLLRKKGLTIRRWN